MTGSGFRALILVTGALFTAMVLASPTSCGGVWRICSFDAQFLPYGPDEARAYLASLGSGIGRYLWIVQPLDLVFPAALCLALREAYARFAPERLARRLGRLAVVYAGVDYFENALIRAMLKRPDGAFPDLLPEATSALTTLKWLVLAVLFAAFLRLWLGRKRAAR